MSQYRMNAAAAPLPGAPAKPEAGGLHARMARAISIVAMAFPFTSTLNQLLPVSLNRIVLGCMIALYAVYLLDKRMDSLTVFQVLYLSVTFAYTSLVAGDLSRNTEDMIYLAVTALFLLLLRSDGFLHEMAQAYSRHRTLAVLLIIAAEAVLASGLFDPGCYDLDGYKGYMVNTHGVAGTSVLIWAQVYLLYRRDPGRKLCLILLVLPLYCLMASGARNFLVPMAVLLAMFLCSIRRLKFRMLALLASASLGVLLFMNSSMYIKFVSVSNNPYITDKMAAFTNFRTVLWNADLSAYSEMPLLSKLFGVGFAYIREVNYSITGKWLWAHNDLVNLLLSVGVAGTANYVVLVLACVYGVMRMSASLPRGLMVCVFILFPMLFNGYYMYVPLVIATVTMVAGMIAGVEKIRTEEVRHDE